MSNLQSSIRTPKQKTIISFIVFYSVFILFSFFILINIYDKNSFLNFFEKNNISGQSISGDNFYVIDIDNKITSETFSKLLSYLVDSSTDKIIIDNNFSNLIDTVRINEINDIIKKNENIFSYVKVLDKKGYDLFTTYTKIDNTGHTLSFIKTNWSFIYANYNNDIEIKNIFDFPGSRIGIVNINKPFYDKDNIDILYKFNNKFLMTLPFLYYLDSKKIVLEDVIFDNDKAATDKILLYYDQKGRTSFIRNNSKNEYVLLNFNDFKQAIISRIDSIDNLQTIGLFNSDKKGMDLYVEEEKQLSNIYSISDFKDSSKTAFLNTAKNRAGSWKSFKNTMNKKISKATVIITSNADNNWVSGFIKDANTITSGKNLYRLPVLFSIFIGLIIVLLFLLFSIFYNGSGIFHLIIAILLIIFVTILYYIFRLFLNIDFPFTLFVASIIYGVLSGVILMKIDLLVWTAEVENIYRGTVSNDMIKNITKLYKANKWNFNTENYLSTYLFIDTSQFLQKDMNEENIEIISAKTDEIKDIIKSNHGVIDNVTPNQILSYFGVPQVFENHYKDAINSALQVNNLPVVVNNNQVKFSLILHSKSELYKFSGNKKNQNFSHFGNVFNTLISMLKCSRKFGASIVLSDAVFKLNNLNLPVRMLDKIKSPGVNYTVRVFELLDEKQQVELKEVIEFFHAGLKLFENRKWEEAGAYFRQCLKLKSDDLPAQVYLERCQLYISKEPDESWDGSYEY